MAAANWPAALLRPILMAICAPADLSHSLDLENFAKEQ
jgi:hypothetical protein